MTIQRIVTSTQPKQVPGRLPALSCAVVPGEVVGEIVHDVRNVLALIDAALGMAERQTDARDMYRFIAGARDGVRQGTALTTRLLTAPGSGELDAQPMDANALLRKIEALLQCDRRSRVRVIMELAPDIPECLSDAAQFNAAILNLVLNAREASPDGATVIVSTDRYVPFDESLDRIDDETYVRIRISDSGPGLAPETVPRIFEPFFTTKSSRGTGLGLPQVCAFMQMVGGNLNVISEPGAGTTFELLFPARSESGSLSS